ncbi:MAG: hypothetical protein LUO93_00850 [Methanomicrobiales archaeon]|nr:hypothetical protein [Methanomicrobiales archaeon]
MRLFQIILLLCTVALLAVGAGCAGNQPSGPPITTPTTPNPTTVIPTVGLSLTPGPVQTLPGGATLSFEVNAGPSLIKPTVVVVFRGGSGQSQVQSMEITFIRPNGQFETRSLDAKVGSEEEFTVARDEVDRVVITVTLFSGQRFRVWDQTFDYFSHA